MNNILRVYSRGNNKLIGELYYDEESCKLSDDSDIIFKNFINYTINDLQEILLIDNYPNVEIIRLEEVGFFNFIDKYLYEILRYNWGFKCEQLYVKN